MRCEFQGAGTVDTSSASSSGPTSKANSADNCSKVSVDHSSKGRLSKGLSLSGLFASPFTVFEAHREGSGCENKPVNYRSNGWVTSIKKAMASSSLRRIREHLLGFNIPSSITSYSDIWLLGVCYKLSSEASPNGDPANSSEFALFVEDFSSRILTTYRKGFYPIGDSKYTSDVGWGCMLRSSQMLVAQALVVHRLGRAWRKSLNKKVDEDYIAILHLFGDSEESFFSIHNLLQAGKSYGLAAGCWVGPYAMCRTWETLIRTKRETDQSISLAVHIVSGDEDGERGGAPILCVEDVRRHCTEHSHDEAHWSPIILLVPLVLGLDKVNPRYLPLLAATFTFPQSIGILGGKPGASTYIVGVQDDKALYLDPHDTHDVVKIKNDDMEVDTSSYHCSMIRHFPLESIDPSLAIGFYCRDKDDFDDLCSRASKLADESNGAPLFTVAQIRTNLKRSNSSTGGRSAEQQEAGEDYDLGELREHKGEEDDWQLL